VRTLPLSWKKGETLHSYLIFSDKAIFHLCGIINRVCVSGGGRILMSVWSLCVWLTKGKHVLCTFQVQSIRSFSHRMYHYWHDVPRQARAVVVAPGVGGLPWPFNLPAGWGTTPSSFGHESFWLSSYPEIWLGVGDWHLDHQDT